MAWHCGCGSALRNWWVQVGRHRDPPVRLAARQTGILDSVFGSAEEPSSHIENDEGQGAYR